MSKTKRLTKGLALLIMLALVLSVMAFPTLAVADTYDYVDDTATGLRISVSQETEKLQIGTSSGSTDYVLSSTVSGYFPQSFSLLFTTGTGVSVTLSDSNAYFTFYDVANGYGVVTLSNSSCTITVTKGGASCTILAPAPAGSSSSGSGIMGYLPAPGQFTNEGATTGGWGDAFTSANDGTLKALVNNYSSTGVSLGSFGGYVVLDFGVPTKSGNTVTGGIYNDPSNAYGIDFILYGNVTGTSAEPGCVQVSLDGENWYDIAGSLYYRQPEVESQSTSSGTTTTVYTPGSEWYYSATYTNPQYSDDALAAGSLGTYPSSPNFNYNAKARPASSATTGNGTVSYNTFHRHSWFPLYNNYFADRTTSSTPLAMQGKALANLGMTNYFGADYTATSGTTASTVTLSGVRLIPRTTVKTGSTNSTTYSVPASDYLFGYADVHANGTPSGAQVNPYDSTRTSGGDPIDISWAVEPMYTYDSNGNATLNANAGQPHYLSAIRYIRVYTGLQQMNGIFGEYSTEITGAYRATGSGNGVATVVPTVKINGSTISTTNGGVSAKRLYSGATATINVTSSADYIYINGELVSSGEDYVLSIASGNTYYVQIITQNGTESPYLTVLKITR